MPTYPHVTLACFDCKRVGSVPASDSSLPRQHLVRCFWSVSVGSFESDLKPSRILQCQTVARALAVHWQAETLASTEPPLIIWSPSHAIRCRVRQCLTPTVKKHVTYCGLICPSIKTNTVKMSKNMVKICQKPCQKIRTKWREFIFPYIRTNKETRDRWWRYSTASHHTTTWWTWHIAVWSRTRRASWRAGWSWGDNCGNITWWNWNQICPRVPHAALLCNRKLERAYENECCNKGLIQYTTI